MRQCDIEQLRTHWPAWAEVFDPGEIQRVGLLSPDQVESSLVLQLFPWADIVVLKRGDWDLNETWEGKPFDLLVACNVFMYSPDPGLWFTNVLRACRHLWIQDNIRGWRGGSQELGQDGDSARFTFWDGDGTTGSYLPTRVSAPYTIDDHEIDALVTYPVPSGDSGHDALAFVAEIRGEDVSK